VARLRAGKHRARKPFALMARDAAVIRSHARLGAAEEALLSSAAAPIVLLDRGGQGGAVAVAPDVAPGVGTLGFMLPNTPLHHLMLRRMERPIVLTSGNRSDEPQAIESDDARQRLAHVAEYFVEHDRPIARRVDDSVARVMAGRPRLLRRARGYAPAPITLPAGFAQAPPVLAYGGELKNSFCLLREGEAVLSQHIGDLEEALTQADYRKALDDFRHFFQFAPQALACDLHPEYLSTKLAAEDAARLGAPLISVQHHHAHIAACMAENGLPRDTPPVLGVALDGLGWGEDGTLWGGEFLLADYAGYRRLGCFKPVAMPGGAAAIREPWRNTYAQLMAEMGWTRFAMNYGELELFRFLEAKPRELLDGMLARGVNSPLASSCGRLFDAVAAAVGIAREQAMYEGQGAVELEAMIDRDCLEHEDRGLDYPFAVPRLADGGLPYVEPLPMWQALLGDLILDTPVGVIAARFHRGLAGVVVRMVDQLCAAAGSNGQAPIAVALTGGVFQNRTLFERAFQETQPRFEAALRTKDGRSIRLECFFSGLTLESEKLLMADLRAIPGQG
jgi:hydrogenase maturation protein HypF